MEFFHSVSEMRAFTWPALLCLSISASLLALKAFSPVCLIIMSMFILLWGKRFLLAFFLPFRSSLALHFPTDFLRGNVDQMCCPIKTTCHQFKFEQVDFCYKFLASFDFSHIILRLVNLGCSPTFQQACMYSIESVPPVLVNFIRLL